MDYSPAKTSACLRGRGPNFDIQSHARCCLYVRHGGLPSWAMAAFCGCPLIGIRQLIASSTGAYPHGMTSLRVSPDFDLTLINKFNQNLTGGSSIICA